MNLKQISLCSKALDFKPQNHWPETLPAMAWNSWLVTGFDRDSGNVIPLSGGFLEVFRGCYQDLQLPELARIWRTWSQQNLFLDEAELQWSDFFQIYGYRLSPNFIATLEKLSGLPLSFQNWCSDKKISVNDLAPLRALENSDKLSPLMESIACMGLSKSLGCEILEWLVDLNLLGVGSDELLPLKNESASHWRQRLWDSRHPKTAAQMKKQSGKIQQVTWPKHTQVKWVRQGDRSGLELKLFVSSPDEYYKTLQQLGPRIETQFSQEH